MFIDLPTLIVALAFGGGLQVLALLAQHRAHPSVPGVAWWAVGSATLVLGLALQSLHAYPGAKAPATGAGAVLFFAGMATVYGGAQAFFGRRVRAGRLVALGVAFLAANAVLLWAHDEPARRTLVSATIAGFAFLTATRLWEGRTRLAGPALRYTAAVFAVLGTFFALRAVVTALGGQVPASVEGSPLQTLSYVVGFAFQTAWNLGFILLVNERLNGELEGNRGFLSEIIESNRAIICAKTPDGRYTLVNSSWVQATGVSREDAVGRRSADLFPPEVSDGFERVDQEVLATGKAVQYEHSLALVGGPRHYLTTKFPLRAADGAVTGVCAVCTDLTDRKRHEEEIRSLVRQLEVERNHAKATAIRDPLTRLSNRRHLDERIVTEFFRLKRTGKPLSLILVDVDHFKRFNDAHGHVVGDECLQRVAAALGGRIHRPGDLVARYGGEEFAVLLPETELAGARELAEGLRQAVADLAIPHPTSGAAPVVTLSVGVATRWPAALDGPAELVVLADEALYRAKAAGRNRVEAAPETAAPGLAGSGRAVWSPAHEFGHAQLDGEHRALHEAADRLLLAMQASGTREDALTHLREFLRLAEGHFRSEEAILASVGWPGAAAHARRHETLLARARALAEGYARDADAAGGDLAAFVAHDLLTTHHLREDQRFVPWLLDAASRERTEPDA